MVGDREQFLAAGADGYLAKPFRAQELYATLEEIYSARSEDTGSSREARSAGR